MEVTQGDEVDPATGELAPDVPEDGYVDEHTNTYQRAFYESNDLPVREGPVDQSGAFYTDCRSYADFESAAEGTEFTQKKHYEDALPGVDIAGDQLDEENDACWVGYLDKQYEYAFAVTAIGNFDSDPVYFLNPAADDEDCQHGDWFVAQAQGDEGQIEDCSGDGHDIWMPGSWHSAAIDVDLIEGAFAGDDGTNCQEATCGTADVAEVSEGDGEDARDYHGSGTISLPLEYTATTFLFGYPHPDNPDSGDYAIGPDDPEFSQPLWGVPDKACGDRVPADDCQLLGPKDLKHYDTFDDNLDEDERGRLCSFNPDSSIANPQGLAGGPCGIFGSEIDTFIEETTAGGFGTDTVSTYQSTFPGWKNPLMTLIHSGHFSPLDAAFFAIGSDYDDKDSASFYYDRSFTAVNPKVPNGEDQVWCMRPQIMTDGETVPSGPHAGASAPGVYGTYQAAAIDVDMHPAAANAVGAGIVNDGNGVPGYEGFEETTDPVLDPVGEVLDQVLEQTFDVTDEVFSTADDVVDQAEEQVPEETPVDEQVGDALDTTNEAVDTAFNTSDRVGPTESSDPEPSNQVGDDNWDPFEDPIPTGIACENGVPIFSDGDKSLQGALQFDNDVLGFNAQIKDPTIFDEAGLPADEDNTTDGTWQTDSYSFSGPLRAFVDSSGDESFSGCAPSDGEPHPEDDNCVWSALWDAYNPSCTSSDGEKGCDEILRSDGYAVDEQDRIDEGSEDPFGVGLVSTLEVSGTTLLYTTSTDTGPTNTIDRWQIVNQDPAQSTCVIMTSHSFQDKLATHVGDSGFTEVFDDDEREALCPDHTDDQIVEWHDAFFDQAGPGDQGYSSAVEWAKITPTPDAVREAQDMQDDRLCLTAVFSTAEDRIGEGVGGTENNLALGSDSTTTYYTDCDLLTSHEDPDGEPSDDHPLDGKSTTFPDFSQRDTSYRG